MESAAARPETEARPGSTGESSVPLDQWRGLALLLVLVSHGFYHTNLVHGLGRVGVNLFFFISGVLVYRSLARHEHRPAWERARLFWWRRFRRLFPALLAYVTAMAPVAYFAQHLPGLPMFSSFVDYCRAAPVALVYLINYYEPFGSPRSLGHLWSVACEMQFYLVAPLIFAAGGRTAGQRRVVWGALLLVLMGLGAAQPFLRDASRYEFQFAVWPMMLGFCCEWRKPLLHRLPRGLALAAAWAGLGLFLSSVLLMLWGRDMKTLVIASGALVLAPCFIFYAAGIPMPGPAGAGLRWLGERTYSIYLWQQPLTVCEFVPAGWRPAGAVFSTVLGGLWFRVFERPFLSASRRK
jgi:peptidoglycan/LPS O-acetylase OafA/YrhL